ncbi:hypothetical protein BDV23DRAFT_193837 [Aspergillus alliaceus]|uniref:Zn(2)-C6 fungal-type domain-containing protein n=1 Tax=Petromyces alliaceus TaxID=209559 RepID=A0A5N7C807_PETAA|nr:hypothetical protein BDV23DRAFT_193837 [Aspergillus alliaceus]
MLQAATGSYTPEWYAFQEYHSPDDGSIVAIITPFIDTAMGLMLLFGAHTLRLSAANRLPAANISLVFFTMGLLIQVSAEKDYVGDVALCDRTQPICQRCIKSHRTCYGMRDQQVWHAENAYASRQKKRPRGPRSTRMNLTVAPTPIDLKTRAIAYYMHNYLQNPPNVPDIVKEVTRGCLPVMPPAPWCSILDLAISSQALAVFSRTQHYPEAAIVASSTYHQLLQIVQPALQYLSSDNIDSCLLAVFFMGRYEDSVYAPGAKSPFTLALQSFSHHDGALAILKVWNDRLSRGRPATNVIKHTRRGMIRSALMRNAALPEWICDGTFFGEHGLDLEYDQIIVRLANLRHQLFALTDELPSSGPSLLQSTSEYISRLEQLDIEAQSLDADFEACIAHVPRTWLHPQQHALSKTDLPSWPSADFYSPVIHSYPNPAYAALWGQYHAARMLVKNTRLRILALSNSEDTLTQQQFLCDMQSLSNDLASTIPFALQRVRLADTSPLSSHTPSIKVNLNYQIKPSDASLIIWPLTIASSLEYVSPEQKVWFKARLARLGRLVGIGALQAAETDQWLEL